MDAGVFRQVPGLGVRGSALGSEARATERFDVEGAVESSYAR